MRILIVGLNFFPEVVGVGKYTSELAFWLVDQEHNVRVITGYPYYPQWSIAEDYKAWKYQREEINEVEVIRCPLWVPGQVNGVKRIFHLLSFGISSTPAILTNMFWNPDVVIGVVPTYLITPQVLFMSTILNIKSWLHVQDFELDTAFNLDMLPGKKWVYPFAKYGERFIYHSFDCVSTISRSMLKKLWMQGVKEEMTYLLPNWIDTREIYPQDGHNPYRDELDIGENQIVVLYSGNMGKKQGLEILPEAARELPEESNIIIVLCGDGVAREDLENQAKNLERVRFIPLQPKERLNDLLNLADIHVLPQRAGASDLVMPSKLTGMLASGKPVIATAEYHTELGKVVSRVGKLVPPGDPKRLAEVICRLACDDQERDHLGKMGRAYAVDHWGKEKVLQEWVKNLEKIVRD